MPETWFLFDFPGIKEFVFGTDKAREIRGASGILDSLNRHYKSGKNGHPPKFNLPEQAMRQGAEIVYSGGGRGLFIFKDKTAEQVEKIVKEWRKKIWEETKGNLGRGGINFVYSIVQRENGRKEKEIIDELHAKLGEVKGARGAEQLYQRNNIGIIETCQSCHKNPAETVEDEEGRKLCLICHTKRSQGGELGRKGFLRLVKLFQEKE